MSIYDRPKGTEICPRCNEIGRNPKNKICESCFFDMKNLRLIEPNEIVLDCDVPHEEATETYNGDLGVLRVCQIFSYFGNYRIEIYKAEGQKSFHAHIKEIPEIDNLTYEQNKLYKERLIKKAIAEVRKYAEAPELEKMDYSLCGRHGVAQENKPHYKYKTIKKLIAVINPQCINHVDTQILRQVKNHESNYKPIVKGSGITAEITKRVSIIEIARKFGLDVNRFKALCPFHPDNNTPSLHFYEEQGRFHCFGCGADGNIIVFYALMKRLNPDIKIK